jgi:ankyrin repeat protein
MIINRNDIVIGGNPDHNKYFTDLNLAITYSRYGNNFNINCENIVFEDINLKDISGWTPLYCAVRESNRYSTLETTELILKCKPDINIKSEAGFTALHICCIYINSSSNIETMKLLLEYDANVNLLDWCGETPLFKLVLNKNLKAINLLLKYGAKINIKNRYNESSIDISIKKYKFNSEIAQTLLTFDKNINYKFSNYLDFNFIYKNLVINRKIL